MWRVISKWVKSQCPKNPSFSVVIQVLLSKGWSHSPLFQVWPSVLSSHKHMCVFRPFQLGRYPTEVWSGKFWILWRLSFVMWFFFWNWLMRGWFAGADTLGVLFVENRHVVLFWKLPGTRVCDAFLVQMLERAYNAWNGNSTTDSGGHCGIDFLWAFLILFFTDDTVALVHLAFFTDQMYQRTFHAVDSCLLGLLTEILLVSCGLNYHCWFMNSVCEWIELPKAADLCELNCWCPDNKYWNCPKELFLNMFTSHFVL